MCHRQCLDSKRRTWHSLPIDLGAPSGSLSLLAPPAECRLGRNRFDLHQVWSPNLGPPFGVWSCVRCECVPVQKKRRTVAKVQCRNVKDECPKATCRDPVILPGACCKTCPEHDHRPADEPLEPSPLDESTGKDFAVLLNGRTSQTPMTTSRVATGRLSLRRKTLHFSFLLEDGYPTPASIQFLSEDGNILEQLEAQPTPYEATNNRVCGTWTRVPREYRALLREEKMWVALQPPSDRDEDVISGQVARYVGVDTEVFSALLRPSPAANQTLSGGGTAIISVDARTDSLHISLVFNGIFGPGEAHNATLVVELTPQRALPPVTDTVVLTKVFSDINRAELLTTLGDTSLRLLTRGLVSLKVWSQGAPELALEGMITPRATCNVYSTVLSPPSPPSRPSADAGTAAAPPAYGSGWALLTLSNDGAFQYQVFVQGLEVKNLTLETTHRRRHRIVDNITQFYADSWANGTYSRPTYRDLDALLRGKLEVVASSGDGGEELRGMLVPLSITEALRSPQPVLLSHPELPMAATVWVAVDSACVMHYDVMVAGTPPGKAPEPFWNLTLREEDSSWDPRFDMNVIRLEDIVEGWELSAHSTVLMPMSLSRLGSGVSYLDLALVQPDVEASPPPLTGRIAGVSVPPACLLASHNEANVPEERISPVDTNCMNLTCMDEELPRPVVYKCIDEDMNIFEDGTSWPSPVNPCSMCMCSRGVVKCVDFVCPRLECEDAYTPPGECCPVCPGGNDVDTGSVCELNNLKHRVGSKWHPFLAPKGFDTCSVCTCLMSRAEQPYIDCFRSSCPPLPCPESEIVSNPSSCCPVCRETEPEMLLPPAWSDMPNDRQNVRSRQQQREDILRRGGCSRALSSYENGEEWHPRVAWIGDYKCVTCKCKDGNITCSYLQCPKLNCQDKVQVGQECCLRCANRTSNAPVFESKLRGWPRSSKKNSRKKKGSYRRRNSG
ncbi:dorsal-ventral patterning protein Sog-like [Penaeus monodon]|uniref:dorsal-ventral patterning protein Sog-like n=1 Tax=Penaeus monodon TaxID=6687 RepID=UPI0018A7AD03|nr:dorsal-ventral patterning protein Sog-like [Penaeus monodon]